MSLVDMSENNKFTPREEMWFKMAEELYPNLNKFDAFDAFVNNKKQFDECNALFDKYSNQKNDEINAKEIFVHCPGCGYGFTHEPLSNGKAVGGISGASAGAILGAKVGIAMGPLGAIAGTIPGAILGGIFGNNIGNNYDKPRCPNCGTKFEIPDSLK